MAEDDGEFVMVDVPRDEVYARLRGVPDGLREMIAEQPIEDLLAVTAVVLTDGPVPEITFRFVGNVADAALALAQGLLQLLNQVDDATSCPVTAELAECLADFTEELLATTPAYEQEGM